jgi:hypothetical protein
MTVIIILLTFIITLILQDRYFKNKKNYKNKNIKIYQELKIPIFVTCIVILIYDIIIQEEPEISPGLFMTHPCF